MLLDPQMPWTRRRFLKAAGAGALGLLGAGGAYEALARLTEPTATPPIPTAAVAVDRLHFRSRPDLSPPRVTVGVRQGPTAPGYVFLTPANGAAPDGPLIVDDAGEPIWVGPRLAPNVTTFGLFEYRGAPVLALWEGTGVTGYGYGDYVLLDTSYQEVARVRAGNGYRGDLHEFLVTPQGTAIFDIFNTRAGEIQTDRGPAEGLIIEGVLQEVDIATGKVVFEWHSADHVSTGESYFAMPRGFGEPYDYFHINSIDVDTDGNLLVSSRHCWTIFKVDRHSGEILWRLGGKRSDFAIGPGAEFSWQHHVRHHSGGRLTIFDNGAASPTTITEAPTRGLLLNLDTEARQASLVQAFIQPEHLECPSQGTVQLLSDGHVFMGWGSQPRYSEFTLEGHLLLDASFPTKGSYRTFRFPWQGRPTDAPAIAVAANGAAGATLYASWNGATEVARWDVLAGPSADRLSRVGGAARSGFETAIAVPTSEPYVAARAMDAGGSPLATSRTVAVPGR